MEDSHDSLLEEEWKAKMVSLMLVTYSFKEVTKTIGTTGYEK
jgi:hypothetical protein